jgi:4-amino-4-deoxy-L-arabinose transferase-like glycosyltransferase
VTETTTRARPLDLLLLLFLALALLLPGQTGIPPVDRDESRYAVATSQMLATGNLVDIRYQDVPRYLQPAGIYWLQSASVALFSAPEAREIWAYRLPSLAGAVAAVLLTAWLAGRLFGRWAGLAAGVLLATSLALGIEARTAKIDAMLLAMVVAAQSALALLYLARATRPRLAAAAFWIALAAGVMLKGPIILMVCGLTVAALVAWDRQAAWLSRLRVGWGVPLMAAIVLPWLVAIAITSEGEFFARAIGQNLLGKVATGQQAHGAPPGYHLAVFTAAFWPGSLFAVLAVPHVWRTRTRPETRYLVAWIVPTWIAFELVATKLPHYVLPTYPAVACLAAAALVGAWPGFPPGRARYAIWGYAVVWMLVAVALAAAAPGIIFYFEHRLDWMAVALGLAAVGLAALAVRLLQRRVPAPALASASCAAALTWASTFGLTLPRLDALWMSPRIVRAVDEVSACDRSLLVTTPYHEPSLVFLHGYAATELAKTPAEAADFLAAHAECGVALVGRAQQDAFVTRAAALGAAPRPVGLVEGRNYSNGRRLALTLYVLDGEPGR